MADTNTYISKQKVEKWTTKEKFNALDPLTIETGTEYNLTGPIDETDLASNLQTKINEISNKLTKPTNPSAESAVTMLADGTVGTKPLSQIGGGKLYLHKLHIINSNNDNMDCYIYSYQSLSFVEQAPTADLKGIAEVYHSDGNKDYYGTSLVSLLKVYFSGNTIGTIGGYAVCGDYSSNTVQVVPLELVYLTNTFTDTVTEL